MIYDLVKTFKNKFPFTIAWRLRAHAALAEKVVDDNEEIRYVFAAQKNDSHKDLLSTNVVVITTQRIIFVHKRIFPGYFVNTITKDKINDIHFKTGLIWGKIMIDNLKERVTLSNIDKNAMNNIEDNLESLLQRNLRKRY